MLWALTVAACGEWGPRDYASFERGEPGPSASRPVAVRAETGQPFDGAVAIAIGLGHRLALRADGTVWAWGNNAFGQLGDGTTTHRTSPVRVARLREVVAIGAAFNHSLALTHDGVVWSWGENHRGQLGDGTLVLRPEPVPVILPAPAKAVAAGWTSGVAVLEDETVWGWGDNFWGQLGDGTRTARSAPVPAIGLRGITAVSMGDFHTLALDRDGGVWALGENLYGQLGDGTTQSRAQPARVVTASGDPLLGAAVTAGAYYSLVRMRDGTAWSWGGQGGGPLPSRTGPPGVGSVRAVLLARVEGSIALAGGMNHALALQPDGSVRAWGDNHAGQLGDGTTTAHDRPALVLGPDGAPLDGITAIAAYRDGSLALRSDGTVWAWGAGAGPSPR
jgi:alpha-tubulin suppressor-like RCC1 family protein